MSLAVTSLHLHHHVVDQMLVLWDQAADKERLTIAVEVKRWLLWQGQEGRDAIGDKAVMSNERGIRPDRKTLPRNEHQQ